MLAFSLEFLMFFWITRTIFETKYHWGFLTPVNSNLWSLPKNQFIGLKLTLSSWAWVIVLRSLVVIVCVGRVKTIFWRHPARPEYNFLDYGLFYINNRFQCRPKRVVWAANITTGSLSPNLKILHLICFCPRQSIWPKSGIKANFPWYLNRDYCTN